LNDKTYAILEVHDGHPVRRTCMHCVDPACASVCPVRALEKTEEGPVVYHADRCMGCRYCMMACPFKVPRYEWSSAVPRVRKCVMCNDRVARGKRPACTLFCPADAIRFGDREELLAEAKGRIAKDPDHYYPHVYGEKEVGGTAVLIIAAVPPEKLGLPTDLPSDPLPKRTWQVLSRLPGVVAAGAAFCVGMWWLIERRNRVAEDPLGHAAEDGNPEHEEISK
jgi:formate dehydrogenase iron-sulfur subunit